MSFREKWEKLERAFPRKAERVNDSHTNTASSLPTGLPPNTPILRFLSPTGGLGLSNSDSQSANSNFGGGDTSDTLADLGVNMETLKLTARRANKDELGWIGVKRFQLMLSQTPDIESPLKLMADEFTQCIDLFERAAKGGEHRRLRNELDLLFHELGTQVRIIPSLITPSVETLCHSICEKLRRIRERQSGRNVKWYLRIGGIFEPDEVLLDYRRIRCDLQRLLLNMDTKLWQVHGNQEFLLECLRPSFSARHDSSQAASLHRGACTPGTRTNELDRMRNWIRDPDTNSTYWLSGMAGTGKTTIIYSLCEQLDNERLLAASFFCSRSLPECREVDRIMRSIAYQLAQFSYPFRCALSEALKKDPELFNRGVQTQFQRLISNPLVQVQETMPEGLVVVIDALDECEDKDSTSQILEALLKRSSHLPVKFIASSRPESVIQRQMDEQRGKRVKFRLVLHEIDEGAVKTDIETYLRQALTSANPSNQQIVTLAQQAGTLFIYAATIVRYVTDDGPANNLHRRLEELLDNPNIAMSKANNEIDALYTTILELAIDNSTASAMEREDLERVLGVVTCAHEQLTVSAISYVLGMTETRVRTALQALTSVLLVWGVDQLVTTLHASFLDFMLDPKRSSKYCRFKQTYQEALALGCFRWIRENRPQFNICGLESSFIRDSDIPDLRSRVDNAVSWELYYACRHWAAHLKHTRKSAELLEALFDFLSCRLMLWIEVMNLKNSLHTGPDMLWCAGTWVNKEECDEAIVQLTHGAWQFTTDYQLGAAKLSTPHIYQSMLFFLPPSSPLGRYYTQRMRRLFPYDSTRIQPRIELSGRIDFDEKVGVVEWLPDGTRIVAAVGSRVVVINPATRQIALEKLSDHLVTTFAISPDSIRCATGLGLSIIHVWDLRDGNSVLRPFAIRGTKGATMTATRYSPDGSLIASGFSNGSIHILDAKTGRPIRVLSPASQSFYSKSAITALQFSPNGAHIATAVLKEGIAIWDARTGERAFSSPSGQNYSHHFSTPFSYSPDGTHIATGLNNFLDVWDLKNGQKVLGPLIGHTGSITSVVYSPDGCRIISSSDDGTIRGWDSQTGQPVLGPLTGHNGSITSIDRSPDGTRIVSSLHDNSIRIWDVRIGRVMCSPANEVPHSPNSSRGIELFDSSDDLSPQTKKLLLALDLPQKHIDTVTSVSYSPDNTCIATGSRDGIIRIWDAETGGLKLELGSRTGYRRPITSIVYAPRGDLLISCNWDETIQIWNTYNGKVHETPPVTLEFGRDRWIIANESRLVAWVPLDLPVRELLHSRSAILEILGGTTLFDRGKAPIGESWADCYRSE